MAEEHPEPEARDTPGVEPTVGVEPTPEVVSTPDLPGPEAADPGVEPTIGAETTAEVFETPTPVEAAPEPEPAPPAVDAAAERLDDLLLQVERVNLRLDELARLNARQMEHIDKLHAENQQLRAGELRQALSPLLRALVRHHDNVAKLADSASESSEAKVLEMVRGEVLNVLALAGVDAFEPAPADPFDPARHQGVGRTETDDAALEGTVAAVRRCGFVGDDGRVIRPAEVEVFRLVSS